jgi:hypothetical protein
MAFAPTEIDILGSFPYHCTMLKNALHTLIPIAIHAAQGVRGVRIVIRVTGDHLRG